MAQAGQAGVSDCQDEEEARDEASDNTVVASREQTYLKRIE